ncbi:MAG: alpha/beta hydrolase [Epsilonproteobacteria bacterium]|nr:alpha/beta hydrolase [Campylobacterota bacterium]
MIYIIFLLFTFGVLFVAFYQWQYFMIFSPTYYREDELEDGYEILAINVDKNIELEGVVYEPNNAKATLLFFGGRSHDSVGLIKKLSNKFPTTRIITFNYRSYGKSNGVINEKNIFQDSLEIAKIIQKNYGDFYILGFSLGSSVASFVASKHRCSGVFLVGVYDSVAGIGKVKYGVDLSWISRYKFNNTKIVTNIDAKTYVFVSKADKTTYIQNSRNIKKYYKNLTYYVEFEDLTHKELLWNDMVVKKINEVLDA